MRPSDDETPDRGDGDSLADGVGEVSSSSDPFGDSLTTPRGRHQRRRHGHRRHLRRRTEVTTTTLGDGSAGLTAVVTLTSTTLAMTAPSSTATTSPELVVMVNENRCPRASATC
jgi:hypothetical protein